MPLKVQCSKDSNIREFLHRGVRQGLGGGGVCRCSVGTQAPLTYPPSRQLCSGASILLLSDTIMKIRKKKTEAPGLVGGFMSETSWTSRMRGRSTGNSERALLEACAL